MVTPRATPEGSNAAPNVMTSFSATSPHGRASIARRPPTARVPVGGGHRSPPGSYATPPPDSGGSGGRVPLDLFLHLLLDQGRCAVQEGNHPPQDNVIGLGLEIVEIARLKCGLPVGILGLMNQQEEILLVGVLGFPRQDGLHIGGRELPKPQFEVVELRDHELAFAGVVGGPDLINRLRHQFHSLAKGPVIWKSKLTGTRADPSGEPTLKLDNRAALAHLKDR